MSGGTITEVMVTVTTSACAIGRGEIMTFVAKIAGAGFATNTGLNGGSIFYDDL